LIFSVHAAKAAIGTDASLTNRGICLPNSVKIALFGVFGEANSLGNSMRVLEVYSGSSHRISDVEVQNEH
jgi:hypothetical protein